MDIKDLEMRNKDEKNLNKYENDDMITTVITSIPNTIDRNIQFMNDAQQLIMGQDQEDIDNNNLVTSHNSIQWMHSDNNNNNYNNNDNNDKIENKLNVYQQRKEKRKKVEIRESKKKYQRKVKKMLKFVKEFNRNKKRKANSKHRKKKPKRKK